MKNLYLIILSIGCLTVVSAQQNLQNANWALSENAGLQFTPTAAIPSTSVLPNSNIASASVSDQEGNLLFYTDGLTVWNATHAIMTNGTGLLGYGGDFSQNIVIVPNPADANRYYIVYISVGPDVFPLEPFHGLRYSEVDMTNGTGEVLTATLNTPLMAADGVTPIDDFFPINFGKITTARHGNELDYWILCEIGLEIFAYLVDDNGINAPVVSTSPLDPNLYLDVTNSPSSVNGPMKISPDNQRLLIGYSGINMPSPTDPQSALFVGFFDENNGTVGNFASIETDIDLTSLVGAEFSPNSLVVHRFYSSYVVSGNLDSVTSGVWNETNHERVVSFDGRTPQRAIDGRIYFEDTDVATPPQNGNFIGVINNPDGPDYDILHNEVDVNNVVSTSNNIPPWVHQHPCVSTLTTDVVITISRDRERFNWINSTDILDGSAVICRYHAGDFVELNPGFETRNDAGFVAYIQECDGLFDYRQIEPKAVTQIKEESRLPVKSANGILIYPNPSNSKVTIALEKETISKTTVFSIDGKVVYETAGGGKTKEIEVSEFVNGIYLVVVETVDGQNITSKFIKN